MRATRTGGILLFAAALCVAAYVYLGDPAGKRGILLPCFFHKATGLYCPGCGATRGTWKLLHGDVTGALGSNLLLPFILAIIGYELTRTLARMIFGKELPAMKFGNLTIILAITVTLTFTILRNIPVEPFCRLAP